MKIFCDIIANPNKIILHNKIITIEDEKIKSIENKTNQAYDIVLENAVVFPGMINIHDHLKYSWHKKIGNEGQYKSVYYWLRDLYKEYDPIVKDDKESKLKILFQLGIYKQIFSATTTVVNHSRYPKQVISEDQEFVDIFDDFERELVVQSDFLQELTKGSHKATFFGNIVDAHSHAIKGQKAFMIHAAEGRDFETETEIKDLGEHGILTPESILVHCINTDEGDVELIKNGGCSVVWCPSSSIFVTGKIPNIKGFIEKGINVCIGTDSSCSGGNSLLEELQFAKKQYEKAFGASVEDSTLFDMVTSHAAKALRQEDLIGSIDQGHTADIAIIDKKTADPYNDIINSNAESIIALLHKGMFIYGDESYYEKFNTYNTEYYQFSINGRKKRVVGSLQKLISQAKDKFCLDDSIVFPFIPKEVK